MNRRITVRAVVVHEGKLLGVRLNPTDSAPQNGTFWCVPGGGLDPTEDLMSGLRREMLEETGIEPKIGNLLYIQQYQDQKGEYLEFFFDVTNSSDYLHVDLTQTTHGTEEIAEIRFINPSTDNLLPHFLTEVSLPDDISVGMTRYFNYL